MIIKRGNMKSWPVLYGSYAVVHPAHLPLPSRHRHSAHAITLTFHNFRNTKWQWLLIADIFCILRKSPFVESILKYYKSCLGAENYCQKEETEDDFDPVSVFSSIILNLKACNPLWGSDWLELGWWNPFNNVCGVKYNMGVGRELGVV